MFFVTPLCPVKLLRQTCSLLLVTIVKLAPLHFLYIPNHHWSWGVLFTTGLTCFLVGVYHKLFLVFVFELVFFYLKSKNVLRSWFINGVNMLNHLIVPRNPKICTWFSYIWWCIRLLRDNYLMILAWSQCPYNRDCYFFVCINPWYRLFLSV